MPRHLNNEIALRMFHFVQHRNPSQPLAESDTTDSSAANILDNILFLVIKVADGVEKSRSSRRVSYLWVYDYER